MGINTAEVFGMHHPKESQSIIAQQEMEKMSQRVEKGIFVSRSEALWHLSANKADDLRFVVCWQLLHHSKKQNLQVQVCYL